MEDLPPPGSGPGALTRPREPESRRQDPASLLEEDEAWARRWGRRSRRRKRLAGAAVLSPFLLGLVWFFGFDPIQRCRFGGAERERPSARVAAVDAEDCASLVRGVDAVVTGKTWSRALSIQERQPRVYRGLDLPMFARDVRPQEGAERDEALGEGPLTLWVNRPVTLGVRTVVCGSRPAPDGGATDRLCVAEDTEWEALPVSVPAPDRLERHEGLFEYTKATRGDVGTLTSEGDGDDPFWPEAPPDGEDKRTIPAETYGIELALGPGEREVATVPLGRWKQLRPGDSVRYLVDGCGAGQGVEP